MRYALVALLTVMIAGLGSQVGVGLPLSSGDMKLVASSKSRQVVFVDKAELAKLHPSWQALSDMRAVLSRAASKGSGIKAGRAVGLSRTALAARAAVKASKALDDLQARKYEALRVRSEAIKAQKMQSAELDWKADMRNIEESAADQSKTVDDKYSSDLLNARIKSMAAEVAGKVASKDGSGMDKAAAEATLTEAKARLSAVTGANDSEKKTIANAASEKIDGLKQASAKKVEQEVQAYEQEQSRQIASGIALAKDEVARQMGPDAMVIAQSKLAEETVASSADVSPKPAAGLGELKTAVAALQARIEKDVDVAVRQLASSNGMVVVFQRRKSAPDATRIFAGFIKKRGWNAYGPVMGGVGSS